MRQLLYAMQFKGQAGPGDKEGTMFAKTTSDSCRITSTVSDAGLEGTLEPVAGGRASFESVVTTFLRWRHLPRMRCRRMSRATRLTLQRSPRALSSA